MISLEPLPRIRLRGVDSEFLGQFGFEVETRCRPGKDAACASSLAHRGQRQGRRAQRIFVGGQLDDVGGGQVQFARDFFDRPARLVDRQIVQGAD